MTLEKLKEIVDELYENHEDEASKVKVRLAMQATYPMKGSIQNFCMELDEYTSEAQTLYIACSGHEDYGCPQGVWDEDVIYKMRNEPKHNLN